MMQPGSGFPVQILLNLAALAGALEECRDPTHCLSDKAGSCLLQHATARNRILGPLSPSDHKSHISSIDAIGGPPRLIQQDEDPFLGSLRALEEFDENSTDECSKKHGKQMLESFRKTKHVFCAGPDSNVTCHERVPFDVPRYMCELRHIEIFSTGVRAANCQRNGEAASMKLGVSESEILKRLESQNTSLSCTSSVDEKALIQMPWDTSNFYEWYGDWITLWETLAVLEWQPKDVQLFLVEVSPRGAIRDERGSFKRPFDEAWSRAFQEAKLHVGSFEQLFGNGICFAHAAIVPHGGLSTTTFDGGRGGASTCSSPSVMASALYLEAVARPMLKDIDFMQTPKQVTLLLRNDTRSFDNDTLAEEAVRSVLPPGWSMSTFRPEEFVSFGDQLAAVANTRVLVGAHGAGLTHLMFLPPKARVVEIFCEDRGMSNRHYANLETMSDTAASDVPQHFHLEVSSSPCRVDSEMVRRAIEECEESGF